MLVITAVSGDCFGMGEGTYACGEEGVNFDIAAGDPDDSVELALLFNLVLLLLLTGARGSGGGSRGFSRRG